MSDRVLRGIVTAVFTGWISMAAAGFLLKREVTTEDISGVPFFAFTVVGLIVALREPRNAVGWVFLLGGSTPTIGFFSSSYAFHAMETGYPGEVIAQWVSSWAWLPGLGTFVTLGLLLFPDGRLPSRRWRFVAYFSGLAILLITSGFALDPGPMDPFDPLMPSLENPFGWDRGGPVIDAVLSVAFPLLPLSAFAAFASLIFRYRHSRTEQRQQIKWFAYSSLVLVLIIAFESVLERILGERATEVVFLFGMVFPSIGAGIGILKYRLYDIDVVINRTLVYGVLTGILGLTYLGIVVSLHGVLSEITRESDLAVAVSTLAVAALFRPLRARVQAFIDRRFYRRRYDARMTLESFSSRLRDDVDLEHLAQDLAAVVRETMQPAHVSVWLRPRSVS